MPTELLTSVFDRIGQPGLVNTALVSRRWRSVSLAHPDHYCHVPLHWLYTTEEFEPRVTAFTAALSYIRAKRLKLSVTLDCGWLVNDLPDDDEETRTRFEPIMELNRATVLPAIQDNLGMLVKLRTDLPVQLNRPLFHHLVSAPAPKLTFLSLKFSFGFSDGQNSPWLPASIFQGVAPRLTFLQLDAVFPGTELASAFSKVRTVEIGCDRSAEVANESFDLTRHFPSLAIPRIKVDMLSDALRDSMVHMDRCHSLHMQFLHDEIFIEPFVRTLTSPIRVSLCTDGVCARLKVTSADKRTRHFVVYARSATFATMASQLTSLSPLVTKMQVDHNLLNAIPILLPTLPKLQDLRVHVSETSYPALRAALPPTSAAARYTSLRTVAIILSRDINASEATTNFDLPDTLNAIDPGSGDYILTICTPSAEKSIFAVEGHAWSSLGAAVDALYLNPTRPADEDGGDVSPTA